MQPYLLHHLLTETAGRHPDRPAVLLGETSLSYSMLESRSNQLARLLASHGVRRADRVGLMLGKSVEAVVSLFGILKAGACYVPIDPRAPFKRVRHILGHCGVTCLLASGPDLDEILSEDPQELPLRCALVTGEAAPRVSAAAEAGIAWAPWDALRSEPAERDERAEPADVAPAYILCTSGSTGAPKGVAITHLNALSFVNMACGFFQIGPQDRVGSFAPLQFDLSVFDVFAAVKGGATIVLVPEFLGGFPMKLAEHIHRNRISVWNSVSSVLVLLASRGRLERFSFEALRLVHFSGDLLPVKYLRQLRRHMPDAVFYNIYGQTEANSSLCYRVDEIPEGEWRIPLGKPFPNFEVFAMAEDGSPAESPGQEGELYIRSSTVAAGYWRDEAKTRESFVADPRDPNLPSRTYRTGDVVRLDREGNWVFVGRKDSMVKSRGYRIELDEIEMALNRHPAVRQAAVIAVPDEGIGSRIVACVCMTDGQRLEAAALAGFCSEYLPPYMVPERIDFFDALPVTPTGKIDRTFLRDQTAAKGT
ncbi:MAG: amino acid adenylation domain-containing protein [bacterium]